MATSTSKPSVNETLYLSAEMSPAEKRAASRRVAAGELYRIAPGIFSPLPEAEWPALLRQERIRTLAAEFPGAVLGYKTAFDSAYSEPDVFLNYTYTKTVELPGMRIHLVKASGHQAGDREMGGKKLYFPSEARSLLDNLSIDRSGKNRNAAIGQIEERLIGICASRGEDKLNELRDSARALTMVLGREREFKLLDTKIGTILGTRRGHAMTSAAGHAWQQQFDRARIEIFDRLVGRLRTLDYRKVKDRITTSNAKLHFAFLESYFSNFIEGTRFEIAVARDIVLNNRVVEQRPKDSHDILGVFRQAFHPGWRASTMSTTDAVLVQMRERHADMMRERPEVDPGEFKLHMNVAGNTRFVEPRYVRGTFVEAVKRLSEVPAGFPRALLAMFIVAEIHPFTDGNGRLARIMMNAELSQAGEGRIIIPTLLRDEYVDCLRLLSREGNPDSFVKVMHEAQHWSDAFDYDDLDQVIDQMTACNAFEESRQDFILTTSDGVRFGRLATPVVPVATPEEENTDEQDAPRN